MDISFICFPPNFSSQLTNTSTQGVVQSILATSVCSTNQAPLPNPVVLASPSQTEPAPTANFNHQSSSVNATGGGTEGPLPNLPFDLWKSVVAAFMNQQTFIAFSKADYAVAASIPPPSLVVRSREDFKDVMDALEKYVGKNFVQLTLEGNDLSDQDLQSLQTLPLSVRQLIRDLSLPDLKITPDQLANLKSFLPNLDSLTVGCTVQSLEELTRTSNAWNSVASDNSCKVTITSVTLEGAGLPGEDFKPLPSWLTKFKAASRQVPADAIEHLSELIELEAKSLTNLTAPSDSTDPTAADRPHLPSSLRILRVSEGEIPIAGIKHLEHLETLELKKGSVTGDIKTVSTSLRQLVEQQRLARSTSASEVNWSLQ